MTLNPPRRFRIAIYLANVLGGPVVAYLLAKGVIGSLEATLWAAEVSAAFLLAGLNAGPTLPPDQPVNERGAAVPTFVWVLVAVAAVLLILALIGLPVRVG